MISDMNLGPAERIRPTTRTPQLDTDSQQPLIWPNSIFYSNSSKPPALGASDCRSRQEKSHLRLHADHDMRKVFQCLSGIADGQHFEAICSQGNLFVFFNRKR